MPIETRLNIKVIPGASRTEIAGWLEETLKIRVSAPPEKGKANKSVEQLLAKTLGLNSAAVTVITGKTSQQKVVSIAGLSPDEVTARLVSKM